MRDRRGGTDTTASGRAFRESRPGERSCGHPAAGEGRPLQRSVTGWDGRGPVTPMPGPALPRATTPPALRSPYRNTDNARSRLHVGWRATTSGGYQRAKRAQEGGRAPFLISWRRRMGIEPTGRGASPGPTALKAAQGTSPEAPPIVRIGYATEGVKIANGGIAVGRRLPHERNSISESSGSLTHSPFTFYFLLFTTPYSGQSMSARATRFPPSPLALLRASFAAPMSLSELSPFPG